MKRLMTVLITLVLSACSAAQITPVRVVATLLPPSQSDKPIVTLTQTPGMTLLPSATHRAVTPIPSDTPKPTVTEPLPAPANTSIPKLRTGQNIEITTLQMFDSVAGWAIEARYHILHTVDGGNTWQDVTPPQGTYMAGGFFAIDSKTAWATFFTGLYRPISAAFVWYTSDGGQSWQAGQPFLVNLDREGRDVPNDYYWPQQLYFIDQQTGWLLVDVYFGMHSTRLLLFNTSDGGKTWTVINDHYHDLQRAAGIGVAFINQETGWYGQNDIQFQWISLRVDDIVATGGWKLHKTLDGGRSFTAFTLLPLPAELKKLEFVGKSADCGETRMLTIAPRVIGVQWTCWVYTEPRQDYNFYALTSDGGQTWQSWLATGNEFFLNAQTGWRLSPTNSSTSRKLQQTTDGGRTWSSIKTVAWQGAQFDFVSEQVGWAIINDGDAAALVHTTDGGHTWAEIKPVVANQ